MFYIELAGAVIGGGVLFLAGAFVGSRNPTQTNQVHKDLDAAIQAGVAAVHNALSAKIKA